MKWNERFIVGRLRRRMLRAPCLDGWSADEQGVAGIERVSVPLTKIDGGLAFKAPGQQDLVVLGAQATSALETEGCELMVGWPERIVIVRAGAQVLYADGDMVHFGPLALDRDHVVERTGFEYLSEADAEVRVELTVRSGNDQRVELLDPGASLELGPYRIVHEHSFDPSDLPGGARHHGYRFVVTRSRAPAAATITGVPHPLDIENAAELLALAREHGQFSEDDAVLSEASAYSQLADRYEGPRQMLDDELLETGPHPALLRRLGESLRVTSPGLWRGSAGNACYGRVSVTLGPVGLIEVTRTELGTMPGRLRKRR